MYRGRIIESAQTQELFANIQHPYTRGLLDSIPSIDSEAEWLDAISGKVPTIEESLSGCAFHPRCSYAQTNCGTTMPERKLLNTDHLVRCHFAGELEL